MTEVGPGEATELKVALLVRAWVEIKPKEPVAEEERLHADVVGSSFSSRFRARARAAHRVVLSNDWSVVEICE